MDEQFRGEDTIDEQGRNATQQRADEEGTVWRDVGPANVGDEAEGEEETGAGVA